MSIPKIIHYCWFGGKPLPEKDKKCIESWKAKCPGYKIIEWNERNYNVNKNSYMLEAYNEKKWGFVPDFARLDIIYTYGGIYLDTDVELLRSLDTLLDQHGFMGFESKNAVAPGLIIASEPNNKLIKNIIDNVYKGRHFLRTDGTIDITASPKLVTDYLISVGLECNNKIQMIDEFIIYPSEYFCPKDYITGEICITSNTYSIHHYNASWKNNREKNIYLIEQKIANQFGVNRLHYLRKNLLWKCFSVVYTKGLKYCFVRLLKYKFSER